MSARTNIREINKIRDQLNKKNAAYFDDVIVHVRSAGVREDSGEEWLLARGRELLEAQSKNKTASKLYGEDPIAFAERGIAELPAGRPMGRARYYLMIPWVALSWTFLLLGLTALIAPEAEKINIGTLLIIALGAIVIVEGLTRLVRREPEPGVPAPPKLNARSIGTYLILLIAVGAVGVFVLRFTPVVTIPYWVSFAIAAAGFIGQRLLLRRR
ncbi:DUF1129 family protein [Saccharibacillus sp. CPCC 101409]|uniref:DUF1129 family protein n=1 Tax=Saccharibacillus sp. CPCC 101409 TaxID=3058041 RepID=UPI002673C980|nr:DUF1129 family protein [Saccharibacillus sp. CPCC 101409]MDO3412563.1 DUF1129 family protein [Saccharibacillus sp. CPCC 101409]